MKEHTTRVGSPSLALGPREHITSSTSAAGSWGCSSTETRAQSRTRGTCRHTFVDRFGVYIANRRMNRCRLLLNQLRLVELMHAHKRERVQHGLAALLTLRNKKSRETNGRFVPSDPDSL